MMDAWDDKAKRGWLGGLGFTVAELMVASVVMATALLGVYSLFRQAVDIERSTTVRWAQRAAADAVASHMAESLEHAVNLPNVPAIVGSVDGDGVVTLACVSWVKAASGSRSGHAAVQRRLYRWQGASEEGASGVVELRALVYAGTVNVTAGVSGEEQTEAEMWERSAGAVIGRGIEGLTISYRPASNPKARWEPKWSGPADDVAVVVRVRVGDQTIERTVVPPVRRLLVEEGQTKS